MVAARPTNMAVGDVLWSAIFETGMTLTRSHFLIGRGPELMVAGTFVLCFLVFGQQVATTSF